MHASSEATSPELFIYISDSPAKHFPWLLYQTRYGPICFVLAAGFAKRHPRRIGSDGKPKSRSLTAVRKRRDRVRDDRFGRLDINKALCRQGLFSGLGNGQNSVNSRVVLSHKSFALCRWEEKTHSPRRAKSFFCADVPLMDFLKGSIGPC